MEFSSLIVSFLRTQTERFITNSDSLTHTNTQTVVAALGIGRFIPKLQVKLFCVVFFSDSRSEETREEEEKSSLCFQNQKETARKRGKITCTVYSLTLLALTALLCSAIYTPLSLSLASVRERGRWLGLRTVTKNMRICGVMNSSLDLTYVSAVGFNRFLFQMEADSCTWWGSLLEF